MAYADQKAGPGRIVAIAVVALLHVLIGYAFISGLAYKYVKKQVEDLDTFDIVEPPPPPEEVPPPPPPPPESPPQSPPPVVTPPPIVRVQAPPPVVIQSVQTPPPVYNPVPVAAPPAPPQPPAPPAPPAISKKAGLRGNPGQFFGRDAYPPSAVREGAEGRVSARLTVGTDGRVSDCVITSSSGNSALDQTTCRISKSRVRFTPAQDAAGNPVSSTYPLSVTWQLEDQ